MLTSGTKLGTFEITSHIGSGGMGDVYEGHDAKLGRNVAIKVLPEQFARSSERLARFHREAKLLASLNHPNIATIHGLEQSGDTHYLVMELVPGETLAQRIRRDVALPVEDALTIARQIAEALEAAHGSEKGIIHRDLKPANVKMTPEGRVKVLDFGLAKAFTDDPAGEDIGNLPTLSVLPTMLGTVMGTAAYMSPEQARGKTVTKSADIWAFGCVLYEMLTGKQAFPGDGTTDILAKVLQSEPDWRAVPSRVPDTIRRLLQRCLQKDAQRRLRDIGDARIEIQEALAGGDTAQARSASAPEQGVRRWRALAIGASVALVSGAAFILVPRFRQAATPASVGTDSQTVATQLTNYGGFETSPALSPDGRSFVFVSDHGGTPDIWLRQVAGGEPVRLTNDEIEEAELAYAPDGETIYYTRPEADGPAIWRIGALGGQVQKVRSGAQAPAPSPDGRSLAFFQREPAGWALAVAMLDGSGERTLVRGILGGGSRVAWSSDGQWISYNRAGLFAAGNLFVIEVLTGQERQVTRFTRSNEGVFRHTWLPGNRYLAVTYSPVPRQLAARDIGILDVRDGSIIRMTMSIGDTLDVSNVSADGSRLIGTATSWQRDVWKVPFGADPDANGRAAVRLLDSAWDPMWTFVSRDGRMLLFNSPASGTRNLWTLSLRGNDTARQITSVPGNAISHSSLSPDGTRVAFASTAAGSSDIWTQNVDGSDLRQLTSDAGADSWPVWSPDGRWIVFTSLREDGQDTRRVPAGGGIAEKVADGFFRGDWIPQSPGTGTWLVVMNGVDRIRLLDVERQAVVWEERKVGAAPALPMFSPDGRLISAAFRENRKQDSIWIFETATGQSRLAARLPFPMTFRASWVDDGRAFIVNRQEPISHVVLFDGFWPNADESR